MLTFVAMLADDLRPLIESQPPFEWNRLGQPLPYEWIERAVQSSGSASVRRRRSPAQQGGGRVVALALYRHPSISEIVDGLELALPALICHLSASAPSPRRGSARGRRPWRGFFVNRLGTGLPRIKRNISSKGSGCSRWTAPRCARPTVRSTASISAHPRPRMSEWAVIRVGRRSAASPAIR